MELQTYIAQLTQNAELVRQTVQQVSDDQARWRPAPGEWSLLEVVNHLYDEERRDFRVRLDYTLNRPGEPWPAIAPGEWVTAEGYNDRDLAESLASFLAERQASLAWLANLRKVDWQINAKTPWGGTLSAGDLLAAWTVHDLLHLRQLNELHYRYLKELAQPFEVEYAGDW